MIEITAALLEAMRQATACFRAGNFAEAKQICEAILHADADCSDANYLLAVIEHRCGHPKNAIRLINNVLAVKPDYAEALLARGNIFGALGSREDALASYDKALAVNPDYVEALNNRGTTLSALNRHHEALESFNKALSIDPNYAEALYNVGNVLSALNRQEDAVASYDKALSVNPNYAEALNNRGVALRKLSRMPEALASYKKSLAIRPNPICHSNLIFALNFLATEDTRSQQAERARWNELYAKQFDSLIRSHKNSRDPHRRLRIGYVSSYFRHQAATYAFGGVLTCHDASSFEVVCYSDTLDEDDVTSRLRAGCEKWRRTAGLSDQELADLIEADGIDILVDCVGHMGGHRLLVFARKPAPIQVTAWGEPTGTGLKTMDYLLADPVLVPTGERALLAERVFDLPNFLGYWVPSPLLEPIALPAIANGYVTFGSFHRLAKIQDPVLRSWATILRALPDARLIIKGDQRHSESSQEARILRVLGKEKIGPERVTLLGISDRATHFAAYQRVDLALDPFPHGGGMTTLDALWMGVPVITWAGHTISSRLAAASLTALGLTDFIAPELESYIGLAIAKASDLDGLVRLRSSLRERLAGSVIGNPIRYTRAVEAAYREMWQRWCAL
jgi:protein O-GlcNAc transferase